MNVREIPRAEVVPTLRRLVELQEPPARSEMTSRLEADLDLFECSPGEDFGRIAQDLAREADRLEGRSVLLGLGGSFLVFGTGLGSVGGWLIHPAVGVLTGACLGALTVGCIVGGVLAGREAGEKRQELLRVNYWLYTLGSQSEEVKQHLDTRAEVERMQREMRRPGAPVEEDVGKVRVGPVRLKKKRRPRGYDPVSCLGWLLGLPGCSLPSAAHSDAHPAAQAVPSKFRSPVQEGLPHRGFPTVTVGISPGLDAVGLRSSSIQAPQQGKQVQCW